MKKVCYTLLLLFFVFLFTCSHVGVKPDAEYDYNRVKQYNYLIAYYSTTIQNDSIRNILLQNLRGVRYEYTDSIVYHNEDFGAIGVYAEPFNRIMFSRKHLTTHDAGTVFIHEYTHAALRGSYMITMQHKAIMHRCIKAEPETLEQIISWSYWTNPSEIMAQVSGVRYLLSMYNPITRRFIDYETFLSRKKTELSLYGEKDCDLNLHVLINTTKSDKALYELLTKL